MQNSKSNVQNWKDDDEGGDAVPLTMANVIGVFYVLSVGVGFSFLYAVVAFFLEVLKISRKNKVCGERDAIISFPCFTKLHCIRLSYYFFPSLESFFVVVVVI